MHFIFWLIYSALVSCLLSQKNIKLNLNVNNDSYKNDKKTSSFLASILSTEDSKLPRNIGNIETREYIKK